MDPVRNPYAPGAGTLPPELAGRSAVLANANVTLSRIQISRSAQSPILWGLRGVGKTVLLVRIKELAEEKGYKFFMTEAEENKSLPDLIAYGLRQILISLSVTEKSKDAARRGLRVLKSFLSGFNVTVGDVSLGVDPEVGVADSGDLRVDLPELFMSVALAARAADTPVIVLLDELQYLNDTEFAALIIAVHKISQANLPLLVVGAGLPQILGLAGEAKSYAERLFAFTPIGALAHDDAVAALVNPAKSEGADYTPEALEGILVETESYPYFLQQWGHEAWNIAEGPIIDASVVRRASVAAIKQLDASFFRVRFDRCRPSERRYMRALAELGPGAHRSGEIAEALGLKVTSVGPTRAKLISKGMIYSPQHGDTAFTVPLFDAFMRRAMPELR